MAMQDRDYYKDAWESRSRGDIQGYHYGGGLRRRSLFSRSRKSSWSLFWIFALTLFICVLVFIFLKIITQLLT